MKGLYIALMLALMGSGYREASVSSELQQPASKSNRQPCMEYRASKPSSDSRMLQVVRRKGILPNVGGMTPQQADIFEKESSTFTAELDLFGDPQTPSVPSMADFAELADDTHAQKALGEAFSLSLKSNDDAGAAAVVRQMTDAEKSYYTVALATAAALEDLGDHFKTGHTLSVQNRPTGLAEDVIVLPCRCVFEQGVV
jgi:hypothetical protein